MYLTKHCVYPAFLFCDPLLDNIFVLLLANSFNGLSSTVFGIPHLQCKPFRHCYILLIIYHVLSDMQRRNSLCEQKPGTIKGSVTSKKCYSVFFFYRFTFSVMLGPKYLFFLYYNICVISCKYEIQHLCILYLPMSLCIQVSM